MKKLLYCAAALAAMFFTACQQENLEPVAGENTVTYTVNVSDVATKAIGNDVNSVNKLYYQVYNNDNELFYDGDADIDGGVASVNLKFVKEQTFKVLFWAQNENLAMFNITDLRAVTLDLNTPLTSNNANAQVFAGFDTVVDCESTAGGNVKLVRPISQLNIATSEESLEHGIALEKSTVSVSGLYPVYNVYEGVASGDKDNTTFEYGEAAVLLKEDNTYQTLSVNGEEYTYVAMNYVGFAPKDASTTVDVEFTITTSEGDVHHTVSNVPVKPNYRTNIVGDLITESTDYNISLDNAWDTEEYTEIVVSTASDLQTTVNEAPDGEATEITLSGDIDFGDLVGTLTKSTSSPASLIIPANKTVVLDLNGYTLSQTAKQTGAHSMIVNNGNLTIVDNKGNGKISYSDTGYGGNYVSNTIVNNGKLVIESGLIENNSSADVASNGYPHPLDNNGELIINGGTLTNNANYASMRIWCTTDDNTSVTINGGTFNGSIDFQTPSAAANKGSLTITGGTFNADTYTKCAVRLLGFGADVDEMLGYINGGTFNGEIALRNWSGADFNSQVFYITGGQFSKDPSAFVVDGYPVIAPTEGGYYTIGQFVPVAKIGDQEYGSLKAAVAAVQDGGTITLVNNISQTDGVIITDKKITIDLNDKTYTVTNGANTNNRNFKINGSSVVTIKNGTMVAAGEYSSGAYGTVRTEGTANVTLTNVKLYNYRGNGLNVKALSGTTVTISDTEVYSVYGGGIEAAGGTIELTNVKVEQKGMYTAPYNSMTISVNGGGTVTVNSGTYSTECITAEEANNQGTSHGPWCAGVLNSGGTLIIKGGTFSNDNFGENSLATAARGLLLADTGANIQINGGTFNAVKNIIDIQNNLGDASRNPKATLAGGTYSSNPLTWDGLISVAEGYAVVENNGTWNVAVDPAAKIGSTEYATLQEAFNVGGNITLLRDVTVSETATLAGGKTAVLDLNGKTLTAAYTSALASTEASTLTVKNGKVVAYESTVRAIGGKVTVESGEYTSTGTALDSPATYRYSLDCREGGELIINGGTFKSNNGLINVGSTVTINGGKFENIVEKTMTRHFAYVSAPLTINDGEFYGKANSSAGGCFFCGAAAGGDIQIKGGKFTSLWTSGSVNRIFEVYYGGTINVTGGMFNTNGGITNFVTANTDDATKAAYPYVAK